MGGHVDRSLHSSRICLIQVSRNSFTIIINNKSMIYFRDIFRGTWFVESLCKVFMEHAANMDLRDMLDETAKMPSEYETEAGTKQSFGYEVLLIYS